MTGAKLVEEMIDVLRKIEEENNEYVDRESTITHGHYCVWYSKIDINEEEKVIRIVCDSDTGFGRNMNNNIEHLILVIKYRGWLIDYEHHHTSGYVCAGYCEALKFIKQMIKDGAEVIECKEWTEYYDYEEGRYVDGHVCTNPEIVLF